MSSYKLSYFNFTGLGEPVRFMLSYAGIEFEDNRITGENWPQIKPLMPMERLPVLEIDGKTYHQSLAICRFIAKKSNLYSSDDYEALDIDAAVDSIDDFRDAMVKWFWNKNPEWKETLKQESAKQLPFYLDKFESMVKANGGYFVGKKLTWPDVFFASLYSYLCVMAEKDITADRPNLKKIVDEVFNVPGIKSYLEKRPKTEF